ncbi:MAG: 16S rRNA (cytosine(1402)-N(4))-methyltransferase RsmH [Candidatus Doudnabacteria bacterium]|nr:16S rRNA (cytosine(1402)-N(4))-methyltransferase RsmH [Candidatus Doudnabacteria bacterium]
MHVPVLLNEVLEQINAKKSGKFVDATVGGGGHIRAIVKSNTSNLGLGIDLDQTSLDKLREELIRDGLNQRISLVHGSYKNIDKILSKKGWESVDGIILDLGFSSFQLDDPDRGFSFANEGPLDMRYDKSAKLTAEEIVNRYHPRDLDRILTEYGEEKLSRRITARKIAPIQTTAQLAQIVKSAIPLPIRFKSADNLRRVFQALRIEVNSELVNLKEALPKMLKLLNPKGRLIVISFHSLEDRIVKEFFVSEAKDCVCPPEFPTCICNKAASVRILSRKPITAKAEEISQNSRSKSAKLRVIEKI